MKTTDARLALRALAAKATLAAALTTCLSVTAWAQPSQPPTTPELTSLIGRLQALYPSTRFGEIRPTPWPGVFEVAMGANLAYVDASGQYFLFGHLYDMKAQRDLTAERKDTLARIDFNALPLADAIKDVRGRGSRALAIFSDPDCPHCRRLEAELKSLSDVTIHTFLMPIASLHPQARETGWFMSPALRRGLTEGRADLVCGFLFAFPMRTFAAILGLPAEQYAAFHYTAIELVTLSYDLEKGLASAGKLADMLAPLLAQRRANPADDLISVLARAEHDGQRLSDEEIYSFLRLLLPAGAETTYRSSSSLLAALLSDGEQLDAVRGDPAALTAAVNEVVRWETPLQFVPRLVIADTELSGVRIPAGATLMVVIGAANHDPQRWDDPERFDLNRPYRAALGFGHGVHLCLGMHLSKMETEVMVRAVLDGLPGLRLDPDHPCPAIDGTLMRSPAELKVVWDA